MCYDVSTQIQRQIKDAKHIGANREEVEYLEDLLKRYRFSPPEFFFTSGFSHSLLPVITNSNPNELTLLRWGLIPSWVKDEKSANSIQNRTLNARGESIFEKPSYRHAARYRRCLVLLSGYFEHYWADSKGKRKIPYYIEMKSKIPFFVSGIWEEWVNKETGEIIKTVSLVTTKANENLSAVHNRDSNNPRMLNIIPFELKDEWLTEYRDDLDRQKIIELIQPCPQEELTIFPVMQLKGKNGVGDSPQAIKEHIYEDIDLPVLDGIK